MISEDEAARALYAEAWDHHMNGCHDLARVGYLRAARIADAAGSVDVRADALEGLIRLDCSEQRYEAALSRVDELIGLFGSLGKTAKRASLLEGKAEWLTRTQQWLDARIAWRHAKTALAAEGRTSDVARCEVRIAEVSERIQKAARADRLAAGPDIPRRPLFGRRWPR